MARLRASWRTSLPVVQQPRNPQSESIARSPYDLLMSVNVTAGIAAPCGRDGASAVPGVTTTGVPTLTRPNRSRMSGLYMRMQPYEAKVPIEDGLLVP